MYLKMFISFIKQSSATLPLNKALAELKKKHNKSQQDRSEGSSTAPHHKTEFSYHQTLKSKVKQQTDVNVLTDT